MFFKFERKIKYESRHSPFKRASLYSLLACLFISVWSETARADINYTFIKVTCESGLKTATIKAFYNWNDAGKARVKRHEKDTYYLSDISGYAEINPDHPLQGEINVCEFGSDQKVSFIASEDTEHPRGNGLRLFLNKKQVNAFFSLANGGWTIKIHSLGLDRFSVQQCLDEYLPTEARCTERDVVNGKIIRKDIQRRQE